MPLASPENRIADFAARRRPLAVPAAALLAAALLFLIAVQAWNAWAARRDRLQEASTSTFNMAKALAAQGESAIRIVDAALADVAERLASDGRSGTALARLDSYLALVARDVPELHDLSVYSVDGRALASTRPGVRPRADVRGNDFRYHAQRRGHAVHVGAPVRSARDGAWIVPVSRRLDNPDGSFAGIVSGAIEVDFFARLYDGFDVGRRGTILLALDTGVLVYRRPYNDALPGTDVSKGPVYTMYRAQGPSGTAMLRARIDNIERLYSYRRMGAYPLIVACAEAKSEILGDWYTSLAVAVAVNLAGIAVLGVLALRLVRQLGQSERLEAELLQAHLSLEEQNGQLAALALRDGMTGIANRRHFEQVLEQEMGRAERNGSVLSLVMLDVDHFKKFNDRYGHVAGDDCLRRVAGALELALVRPGDVAARYGGEEFAGILPLASERGALRVAERIRRSIADLDIPHADSATGSVSVSVGVYTMRRRGGDGLHAQALVEQADLMLYQAKHNGRNRVAAGSSASVAVAAG